MASKLPSHRSRGGKQKYQQEPGSDLRLARMAMAMAMAKHTSTEIFQVLLIELKIKTSGGGR
jgi:hypothetical protein